MMTDLPRSRLATALAVVVALTSLGAIPAAFGLLADPSGSNLGLDPGMLLRGPFSDYAAPGLFLLLVLGVGAIPVVTGLWAQKAWGATTALAYGGVLLAWITAQAYVMGIVSPLQPVYGSVGLLIVAFAVAVGRER